MFFEGDLVGAGSALLSVVAFYHPIVGRRASLCCRAQRALKGWGRLAPAAARLPLPWELVALMA
eukprot:2530465-Lingulodinium_polyedra.AAC.1